MVIVRRPVVVRRGPGLVGTVARTAVIAGTATAVVGAVSGGQQKKAAAAQAQADQTAEMQDMQQQMAAMQAQQAAAATAPAAAAAAPVDVTAELAKLTQLKESGALTDAEFQAAKAKLLAA